MHTIVACRTLFEDDPDLARRLYEAFHEAKNVAAQGYRDQRRPSQVTSTIAWMHSLSERNQTEFDDDWFRYGIEANRTTPETFLCYSAGQGLSPATRAVDELFTGDPQAGRPHRG